MIRRLPILLGLLSFACGDDAAPPIISRWTYETSSPSAPPGLGPERRVVIARSEGMGEVATVDEGNGIKVDEPFATFPTEHAPVASGATIVLVSTIGKVVGYNLAGETIFNAPAGSMLFETSPLLVAADGSLRIANTAGRVLGLAALDGSILFDATVNGAVTTRPAVGADGTTYVATDTGHLVGITVSGQVAFDFPVAAPASGPSVDPKSGNIAVGEIDAVRVVDRQGNEVFKRGRAARVTGTRWTANGELLAWGEDGVVDRLSASGGVISTFAAGPPIYADVIPLDNGDVAVFDSTGVARRVTSGGAEAARIELGGTPLPEVTRGTNGFVIVAVGNSIVALDFELDQ
jgi:hypothetical protein